MRKGAETLWALAAIAWAYCVWWLCRYGYLLV